MEPKAHPDRLLILLRQKLLERSRLSGAASAGLKARLSAEGASEPTGIQAMAAAHGADERSLRRALIQHLLADQLGSGLLNDAQFQQIVSRVTETIEQDPEAAGMLTRLVSELGPA